MKVVILAAGMGKRLKDKTKRHTKSMVKILGKTFIEHSLDKLTKFNISRIIIVIGYYGAEIKKTIGNSYNKIPIVYVKNKDYATTNNIYSLYLTKDYLTEEDTLLLESDFFTLGNGACELINTLSCDIKGKTGIILPTFQEYSDRIKNTKYFIPKNKDFSYDIEDLKQFSKKINTLILINPDNPSGNCLSKKELLKLLDFYKKNNKKIVLDESFIDFSDKTTKNSLLSNEILIKYPNLIIIKSISKSYGIPGIRLGILASSDTNLIKRLQERISIWNINSFAEYFLQIFNKFSKDFVNSCDLIAKERKILFKNLKSLNFLRPIPSQANFILCEVLKPFDSTSLCLELLDKGFLIKDCKNKLGFNGKSYICIAVNAKEDNENLIKALRELN